MFLHLCAHIHARTLISFTGVVGVLGGAVINLLRQSHLTTGAATLPVISPARPIYEAPNRR